MRLSVPAVPEKARFSLCFLRFYEPEGGVIKLDGSDINIKQTSLREQIGMVSQETFLFHDSILNNIRYGGEPQRQQVRSEAKTGWRGGSSVKSVLNIVYRRERVRIRVFRALSGAFWIAPISFRRF